ncbi:spermidine synthase [Planctomicrobium sp. SH527]|uniref:spermidine synthase n=1 Tax=Planctomicrobium sp. SH527 TaxID=3448123 RepID=UPI003F5C9669
MNRLLKLTRYLAMTPAVRTCGAGLLAGACFVGAGAPVRHLLGGSTREIGALLVSTAISGWCIHLLNRQKHFSSIAQKLGLLFAAFWALAIPAVLHLSLQALDGISLLTMQSSVVQLGLIHCLVAVAFIPVLTGLGMDCLKGSAWSPGNTGLWLLAFGVSCVVSSISLLPMLGIQGLLGGVAALAAAMLVADHFAPAIVKSQFKIHSESNATSVAASSQIHLITSLMIGATLAVISFAGAQLLQRNLFSELAIYAGMTMSFGIAYWFSNRISLSSMPTNTTGMRDSIRLLWLAAWVGSIALAYPLLTWFSLQTSARVSDVTLLLASRMGMLLLLVFPAGILFCRRNNEAARGTTTALNFTAVAAGFLLCSSINWTAGTAAACTAGAAMLLAMFAWSRESFLIPESGFKKLGTVSLVTLVLLGIFNGQRLNSQTSEKILFSSHTLKSARQGVSLTELPWMDDGRFVESFESLEGRISLWKYRGTQLMIRQNGISTGMFSIDAEACPQSAADLIPTLLPLAFHPGPQDVLILGMDPAALKTCQQYPLRLVRSLDGRPEAHRLLDWFTENIPNWTLSGGADFQFGKIDPVISLYTRHDCNYDLIVCPLTQPASPGASTALSKEFYQQAASHLNDGGIFAQRVPYYDLGTDVLKTIVNTIRSSFEDVMVVEAIPGELVFLASNTTLPAVDAALVERLKAPQCRQILGQAGWDWSMILARGGLSNENLGAFVATKSTGGSFLNARSNAALETGLPIEIGRWGAKADAARLALGKHGTALRAALTDESLEQDVSHRLEDLSLAHQLQIDHPNDPWGYRKALKDRLTDRPRTALVQVKFEGLKRMLDPEDRRRKDYLVALGEVAKQQRPTPEMISELNNFEAPFDPLVSLFVNHEVVQLLERSSDPNAAMQYRNLLRTIYYANPQDQSTRNVSNALELACDEEQVPLATEERWDHINGLLQVLAQRWQLRWNSGRTSRYDGVDLERSAKAVDKAMKLMASTAPECGLSSAEWTARESCINQLLVRPMRHHRSSQLRTATVDPKVTPATPRAPEAAAPKAETPAK